MQREKVGSWRSEQTSWKQVDTILPTKIDGSSVSSPEVLLNFSPLRMKSQILKNRSLVALKLHLGTGCEGKDDHFYPKKRSIQIHLPSKKI